MSDAELRRRVRSILEESERRQERELALRVAEVLKDVNAQRQADLVKIDRSLGFIQSSTYGEPMKQREAGELPAQGFAEAIGQRIRIMKRQGSLISVALAFCAVGAPASAQDASPARAAADQRQSHYQIGTMERVLEGAVEHGVALTRDRLQAIADRLQPIGPRRCSFWTTRACGASASTATASSSTSSCRRSRRR